jgi:tetratricopeptide (TPR) repeat protein
MLAEILGSIFGHPLRSRRARKLHEDAIARKDAGDFVGARRGLERALETDPELVEALHWLGILLAREGAHADSARRLERAAALAPSDIEIHIDLANVHAMQGDYARAAACYRAALALDANSALAHLNLGHVLKEAGFLDEALGHLRTAHRLAPGQENGLSNLVVALIEADRVDEALTTAARAVELDSASYEAQFLLGLAHQKLNDPVRALGCYDVALAMRDDDFELHDNRGTAFLELGRPEEALASYRKALAIRPDAALPAFHLALTRLFRGDYRGGWDNYELRRLDKDYPKRAHVYPEWDGAPLAGRTLLVRREQGLGDEIMFASCLPQVIAMAKHCVVECEPRLLGIFRRSFPAATVVAALPEGELSPEAFARDIDLEIPAGSIPRFLRRDAGDFPRHQGYLRADPQRVREWAERLSSLGPGLKVGFSWTGGVRKTRRRLRSLQLEHCLPLFNTPGTCFVSLQYTPDAADAVAALKERHGANVVHWPDAIEDYENTAALVSALDLTISVCTAAVHLGGALGRPVWVMAPYSPEWRYGHSGATMPWYPAIRIFRQPAFGEWDAVIAAVATELNSLAGNNPR